MSVHAVPDSPENPPEAAGMVTIAAAVDVTIEAIGPPDADAAVVALARKMATAIDGMEGEQLALMIGQTAPQLLKILQELEARSAKRRAATRSGRPNRVAQLRNAHAQSPAKRKRSG
jgi:hypothetical protein